MLLPVVVALGGLAFLRAGRPSQRGVLTVKRKEVFLKALQKSDPALTPEQLIQVAVEFEREYGLPALGNILRKRAALRAMTAPEKAKRARIFKALTSITDPSKAPMIRQAALAFDADSAFGQADVLRDYASALEAQEDMARIAAVTAPPPPSSEPDTSVPPSTPAESQAPVVIGSVMNVPESEIE